MRMAASVARRSRSWCVVLACSIACDAGWAQTGAQVRPGGRLDIELAGWSPKPVFLAKHLVQGPTAKVTDENNRPVAGAVVMFEVEPRSGVTFTNGGTSVTVTTNARGEAQSESLRLSSSLDWLDIRVTASHGALRATAIAGLGPVPFPSPGIPGWAKLLIAGVGAAGGILAARAISSENETIVEFGPGVVDRPRR